MWEEVRESREMDDVSSPSSAASPLLVVAYWSEAVHQVTSITPAFQDSQLRFYNPTVDQVFAFTVKSSSVTSLRQFTRPYFRQSKLLARMHRTGTR